MALAGDADSDGDGILDRDDRCVDVAGLDPDGCPPRDRDADGVVDGADSCVDVAGPMANDGCPDQDRDGDGVVDRRDQCPEERGEARHSGCPPEDRDRDGILDDGDRCPTKPEVWNGVKDRDGCPDAGAAHVVYEPGLLTLKLAFGAKGLAAAEQKKLQTAVALLKLRRARRLNVGVVAGYGLSYGDSIGRARRQAAVLRGWFARAFPRWKDRVVVVGRPPDGTPRVTIAYE